MTDPRDRADEAVFDDPAFDDPAHDEVRRLLADARVTGPVPDDVAARLDATLASLRAERARSNSAREPDAVAAEHGSVVPLRRRLGPVLGRVAVAAAAIVVIGSGGVGIAQLARDGGAADDKASSADSAGSRAGADSVGPQPSVPSAPASAGKALEALPRLTTARFGRQVSRLMRTAATAGSLDTSATSVPQSDAPENSDDLAGRTPAAPPVTSVPAPTEEFLRDQASCVGPDAPGAVTLPATLDGALVALVFRPPTARTQVVEAWSCDGASLLASASVPH